MSEYTKHVELHLVSLVTQVDDFYFKLGTPAHLIEAHVDNIVRSQLPKLDLDAAYLVKDELALTIKRDLASSMSVYGLIVYETLMVIALPRACPFAATPLTAALRRTCAPTRLSWRP
jgi:hypothetical protein